MEPSKFNLRDKISNFISPSKTDKSNKSEKEDKDIGKEKIISSKNTKIPDTKL